MTDVEFVKLCLTDPEVAKYKGEEDYRKYTKQQYRMLITKHKLFDEFVLKWNKENQNIGGSYDEDIIKKTE